MSVLSQIPTIAKAITGAITAFGAAFAVAYTDQAISTAEWIVIAVSTVVAGVGVWAVPNRPSNPPAT
jgi:presenilin-like A22 family membrane protease